MSMKVWVSILVEYSEGKATILKCFSTPAKDSDVKTKVKEPISKIEVKKSSGEVDMFG